MTLHDLKFTTDWTTSNVPQWQKALERFAGKPGIRGLELGTWEGRSTAWFLREVTSGERARLTTIDRDHSRFDSNRKILDELFPNRLQTITVEAFDWLLDYTGSQFHFIYLDAPKDSADLIDHAVMCWRLLAPGGVLIFDDYMWPGTHDGGFSSPPRHYSNPPRIGIDAFLQCKYLQFDLLHRGWQLIIQKKGEGGRNE
jgi:SAM-dependent methyltransferase